VMRCPNRYRVDPRVNLDAVTKARLHLRCHFSG
jgi:hypothetical protein